MQELGYTTAIVCTPEEGCWEGKMTPQWHDPVVEEVRRIRDQQAARVGCSRSRGHL